MNYYNEHDPKAAEWLRQLILAGEIPFGEVDERSILDVGPTELFRFTQCHFFAGIGGWSLALKLAQWSENMPVWTGSCPCQPFSQAGQGKGTKDERHLWPELRRLVAECSPPIVFGEQVASKDGREWYYAGVRPDLEALGYAAGCADLCAASVGAPHIRQRLYWMGVANSPRRNTRISTAPRTRYGNTAISTSCVVRMVNSEHTKGSRFGRNGWEMVSEHEKPNGRDATGSWSRYDILPCGDGKSRRVESGTFPLANGVTGRVGLLRGYGNAIVPPLAKEFIEAAKEAIKEV